VKATDATLGAAARLANVVMSMGQAPRLSILTFHRVLALPDLLFPGDVDAARFARMMALVARVYRVLPLTQAARLLAEDRLPRRALCITFDVGYADNQAIALPILQRLGLKASFFVATGFIDGGRMWNDSVIECFRHTRRDTVDLTFLGLQCLPTRSANERRAAIDQAIPAIKYMELAAREQALAQLHQVCGAPALSDTLMMRRDQVLSLHSAGMGVGAHTVHHPILTALPDEQALYEIRSGRDTLQDWTQSPVTTLAYPNGRPGQDYDHRHVHMARALGFEVAVSTAVGVAGSGDDCLQLPRFTPWETQLPRWTLRLLLNQRQVRFKRVELPAATALA